MSEGVRTALLALLGLLVVIFGCLIAFAFVLRKRPQIATREEPEAKESRETRERGASRGSEDAAQPRELGSKLEPKLAVRVFRGDAKVCPSCRREFESRLRFCPFDAIPLVSASQMVAREHRGAQGTRVCPTCDRAFEAELGFCPHDGSDLQVVEAHAHDHHHDELDADAADDDLVSGESREDEYYRDAMKICPHCRGRYGFAATFCGKDGVELVVLN